MHVLAFAESIQLFPDGTLFIHIALILGMIWVLNRTFFRPINRLIESRELHKGGRGGEAEKILADVADKQNTFAREMLEARDEGYKLIEKEREQAVAERERAVAAAKQEIAKRLADEKQELQNRASEARATLATEADRMAETITGNILKG
jgi:F0F1-type ATP synthase membrane subunit b/b'